MTETMLVRAARATVRAEQDEWETPADEWSLEALEIHGPLKQARAVLQAIREPALNIQDAGWEAAVDNEGCTPECCWVAMIDAILSQSQEGKHP